MRPALDSRAVALGAAAVLLSSCGGTGERGLGAAATDGAGKQQTLTVYAAASLRGAFDEITADFERAHPGIDVRPIQYDGSSTLALQIQEGAPADVFATADETSMAEIVDADLAADPQLFATNTLVIATPAGNPAGIQTLSDLPGSRVVLCAADVPCGRSSGTLLENVGIQVEPVSQEQNVTAVLEKLAAGEADAGLVYRTDVQGDDRVESIVPEGASDVVNRYPVVQITDSQSPEAAGVFIDYVLSPEGQSVLEEHGFGRP